jgi:hypothetical protein
MAVPGEVLHQTGERRQPASNCGRRGFVDFAHDALPSDDGPVVHLAQLFIGPDVQRPHEMPDILFVCTPCALALLLGKPNVFLGDLGQRRDGHYLLTSHRTCRGDHGGGAFITAGRPVFLRLGCVNLHCGSASL